MKEKLNKCQQGVDEEGNRIQWHPAFYAGIQIELESESANLIFESEHNLSKKPMRIDVLIIKKLAEDAIHKNIGRIFKKYNIVEYKSPADYLSIDDFYKVYGYACFYKSETKKVDGIKITDVTITFASRKYPIDLIEHLEKIRCYGLEKVDEGIYYITNDIIPMQLLVMSELSKEENLWLKSLTNDLDDIEIIDELSKEYGAHEHEELYKAVMDVIVRANKGHNRPFHVQIRHVASNVRYTLYVYPLDILCLCGNKHCSYRCCRQVAALPYFKDQPCCKPDSQR